MPFRPQSHRANPSSSSASPAAPKTIKLSPHALLSLPHRLIHPPPPQPKLYSSWAITPHFRIPLEEILDRKHLPPLGLKDFEEWLLLIDRKPECLYFILWLREYKSRYSAWLRKAKPTPSFRCSSNPEARTYRSASAPPPPNPALVQFYMRAKETFLTPYAPYVLPLPLDVLAQFSTATDSSYRPLDHLLGVPGQPPHPPCPEVFGEVEERVIAVLSDSLDRFVVATFHNVGMPRAYCGCAGGTVIGLTGSVPILLANFLTGGSRWWRFSALPGLWLGMTIVISALYGVCMMIYVFGDLRQLRSFELARFKDPADQPAKLKAKTPVVPKPSYQPAVPVQPPLTGPPILRRESPSFSPSRTEFAPCAPRSPPPKLRLTTPPPVHHVAHVQSSSQSMSHGHMQSVSSASTSYSLKAPYQPVTIPFPHPEDDYESSVTDAGYDVDDDCGSDTEAESETSHVSMTHEGTTADTATDEEEDPRPRPRRRREPRIHISDAIYDDDPCLEGPATGDLSDRSDDVNSMGATFIYPFQWETLDEPSCPNDVESQAHCASDRQRMDVFDFDGLPRRPSRQTPRDSTSGSLPSPTTPTFAPTNAPPRAAPGDAEKRGVHFASDNEGAKGGRCSPAHIVHGPIRRFLGAVQSKCVPSTVATHLRCMSAQGPQDASGLPAAPPSVHAVSPSSTLRSPSDAWPLSMPVSEKAPSLGPASVDEEGGKPTTWRSRMRRMLQVPAFASPLTPVLNPVVTRGQWEIVVRSAVMAFVLSALVIGGLVGAPETRVV